MRGAILYRMKIMENTNSRVESSKKEENGQRPKEISPEEEKKREVDLNTLFPGRDYDLNRLFPDEETKKLLHELKRNKRDIDRFIKSLHLEEE
jgi:hypothetical protein